MTQPLALEDMTKEELQSRYGVSKNLTKSEMIAEVLATQTDAVTVSPQEDPAVLRAKQYRSS